MNGNATQPSQTAAVVRSEAGVTHQVLPLDYGYPELDDRGLALLLKALTSEPGSTITFPLTPFLLDEYLANARTLNLHHKTLLLDLLGDWCVLFVDVAYDAENPMLLIKPIPMPSTHPLLGDMLCRRLAVWARARLGLMIKLQVWLRLRERSAVEVDAYFAVRGELERFARGDYPRKTYG